MALRDQWEGGNAMDELKFISAAAVVIRDRDPSLTHNNAN